ncbi:roadblock/LC7 domain-containing protein [Deinococcus planocerae]|uniref:roadblock/LC7 domain-containing protein n=1 Tax=Deinococcus planocerae TaxID=1737569 RepID=UPI000C7F3E04|nr:roadblock/LC7 domain-containing protein [Deinococcus planocerae]
MTNAVYNLTVRTLSGIVSERAAETMLRAALREQGLAPEGVSARDMRRVLEGPLLGRLSGVLPAAQARAELGALAQQLARQGAPAPAAPEGAPVAAAWDEPTLTVADPTRWDDGPSLSADDFEFDDPDYTTPPGGRTYALDDPADQDALITHLARMAGVQGVLVCRSTGEVLRERSLSGAANLGGVIAATALLFQKRALRLMSADLGGRTVCMRPLGGHCVAVVAGPQVNVGRLLAELQHLREAP